ncbi:hypothetical protein ABPG74_008055 [Tetrahymena malaccensis]
MAYAFFCFQWIIGGCLLMSPIFIFEKPQFQCTQNPEFTIEQCEKWVCQQENPLQYQTKQLSSFVVEFDPPLICSRQWIADTVAALNYGGSIIGFIISIYISDNKGRKIASIVFWLIGAVGCAFIGIFSHNIWLSTLGFSLANAGVNPTITIHFCFINEHSDGNFREYTSASLNIFYSIGSFYLVIAYVLSTSWSQIIVYWIGIPMFVSLFYYYFIYEPPLFLYEKNKIKAVESLNKIAKFNKRPEIQAENLKEREIEQNQNQRIYGVFDLVKFKSIRLTTLCTSIVFFITQISYYGTNFTLSQIGLDTKYNTIAVAFSELLAFSLVVIAIPKLQRRKWSFILTTIYSIIYIIFFFIKKPDNCTEYCKENIIQIALISLSRCLLSFQFSLCYVYFSEIYPTTIRSLGLGFISTIGQIGSAVSAYIVTYFNNQNISPIGIMGICSFISILAYFPLRETYSQPLKNEIDEIQSETTLNFEMSENQSCEQNQCSYSQKEILELKTNT